MMSTLHPRYSSTSIQPGKPQTSRQTASPQTNTPHTNTSQPPSSTNTPSSKGTQNIAYPYQVICERCHRTVLFSGEKGEVFPIICDQCSGL